MGAIRESKSVAADGNELSRSVPNIESRLGGLYSLERLLAESVKDQKAIVETLCAYIRENSPLEIPENDAEAQEFFRGARPPAATQRADVQAALTTIGRIPEAGQFRSKRNEFDNQEELVRRRPEVHICTLATKETPVMPSALTRIRAGLPAVTVIGEAR